MWRELHAERERSSGESALITEACRLADRLDQLDGVLRTGWSVVEAREARLSAGQLRGIVGELRAHDASAVRPGGSGPVEEGDPLDQLAARRAARLPDASG